MENTYSPILAIIKEKLPHILKIRYLIPVVYLAYIVLFWKESTRCFNKIFLIDLIIIWFLAFAPGLLLQFDYLTLTLFFIWICKNSNSEAIKDDANCLDTQNSFLLVFSLWVFKVAIWALTIFMIIIVIFLMISLVREFLVQPTYQGPGLSNEAINNLPLIKYKEYESDSDSQRKKKEDVCPICLEPFELQEEVRMIPNCEHVYHGNCIKTWLDTNTVCPYCRGDVSNLNNSSTNRPGQRSSYAANILIQLQEISLISDIENQGSLHQPLILNR